MKTGKGLAELAKLALYENWGFCLGGYGQILTNELYEIMITAEGHTGEYNYSHKNYLRQFIGNRVSDCYGLVKAYLWWNDGNVIYNPKQDRNQLMAYNEATVKGVLEDMPEIEGLVLCYEGHAGVYIGGGEFIECSGAPVGMRKGRIRNGRVVYGSEFKYWFEDNYINYD